jgi:hypothetical protein
MKEIQFDAICNSDRDQIRWKGCVEASIQFLPKVILLMPIRDPVSHFVEVLPKEGIKK